MSKLKRLPFSEISTTSSFHKEVRNSLSSLVSNNMLGKSSIKYFLVRCSSWLDVLELVRRSVSVPWRRSTVFIVNFEHISHLVLVF